MGTIVTNKIDRRFICSSVVKIHPIVRSWLQILDRIQENQRVDPQNFRKNVATSSMIYSPKKKPFRLSREESVGLKEEQDIQNC